MAEKVRCPKCGSDQVYNRVKTSDFRCKTCGNVFVMDNKRNNGGSND